MWKKFPEKPHPQAHNLDFNFGSLLNAQIAVVLEDEEDEAKEDLKPKRKIIR
jgi:hypothetical protein